MHSLIKKCGLLVLLSQVQGWAFAHQPKAKHNANADEIHTHSVEAASGKPKGELERSAYDYHFAGADGKDIPLADFKGKIILLVNLGRKSDYNSQLPDLIKLSNMYEDKGLVVIGVPSNDFGAAEPGTDAEIQKVYKIDDKVPFPIMARSNLIGDDEIPLYGFLTKGKEALPGGDVHWNYTKFLIDRKGKPIARFSPDVAPGSSEMVATLDEIFSGTYKPAPPESKSPPGGQTSESEI